MESYMSTENIDGLEEVLRRIRQIADSGFFGTLELNFQNGYANSFKVTQAYKVENHRGQRGESNAAIHVTR
jgi:hypothetical protein